jgi:hypothetical protein
VKPLRESCAILLGLWHPMKMLMTHIFRRYFYVLWAPLLHELQPRARIINTAKTNKLHCLFGFMRLAYPQFKDDLDQAIASLGSESSSSKVWLLNIRDLCEYFIPLVTLVVSLIVHVLFRLSIIYWP